MATMSYARAIEDAVGQAMAENDRIVLFGEDTETYRRNLFVRFGSDRVLSTPISESAFVGAAVTAAMAGIRPLVDLTLIDFVGVAMDALLNHAAKVETFSGGRWRAPLVLWAACGGGYGDGGQHEQTLWGWLAHIPGLTVLVPSTPADAGNLMYTALHQDGPVIFLEHKLLADYWLDWMGGSKREGVNFDVPADGAKGLVPKKFQQVDIGKAAIRRQGNDITVVSVGVGVHRSLEAAQLLEQDGIEAEVIDLRTVTPLDDQSISSSVSKTGRLLVVDEDYQGFGLSGEVAARVLEADVPFSYRRVCTQETIPYARELEYQILPNTGRIISAAKELID
jgi:pyruvate/2-oxoglutarate/acetoin dehydrogenase E1 component